jgi:hypothetical protein
MLGGDFCTNPFVFSSRKETFIEEASRLDLLTSEQQYRQDLNPEWYHVLWTFMQNAVVAIVEVVEL